MLLLRDVFDYGYDEIARIVGKSEDNTRQLAVRARRQVEAGRPRFEASRQQRDELAQRFFAAARDADLGALETLLAHDVVLHGVGGGKVPALAMCVRQLACLLFAAVAIVGASGCGGSRDEQVVVPRGRSAASSR